MFRLRRHLSPGGSLRIPKLLLASLFELSPRLGSGFGLLAHRRPLHPLVAAPPVLALILLR